MSGVEAIVKFHDWRTATPENEAHNSGMLVVGFR